MAEMYFTDPLNLRLGNTSGRKCTKKQVRGIFSYLFFAKKGLNNYGTK